MQQQQNSPFYIGYSTTGLHWYSNGVPGQPGATGNWKPIPVIAHDGPLQFEIIMFAYMVVALLLQYLHLYKSVWWLPHSYNSYAVVSIDRTTSQFGHLVLLNLDAQVLSGLT